MEFIKKMKKREFIEATLKFIAGLCASVIAIILMECMIYGIYLNALNNKTSWTVSSGFSVYAHQIGEDEYRVYSSVDGLPGLEKWTTNTAILTKAEVEELTKTHNTKTYYRAPSAFELVIDGMHLAIMAVFILIVIGYFAYRYVRLYQSYKQVEHEFKTTGAIELSNF